MNYSVFIVKIIKFPEQSIYEDDTKISEMLVQIPPVFENNYSDIIPVSVWGTLSQDIIQYYKLNDYILMEGYLSLKKDMFENSKLENDKIIEFSIIKVYPLFLKHPFLNKLTNKIIPF